jgi:secreted trypsin-like serine protease
MASRIAGGAEAIANEFPWMVHFLIRRYDDGQLFSCGGTLISDTHVLTAAHCVIHNETKIHDIFNITLGAHDISATDENFRQVTDWKKIVIPAGDKYFEEGDIAVITLSTPITFTGRGQVDFFSLARPFTHF